MHKRALFLVAALFLVSSLVLLAQAAPVQPNTAHPAGAGETEPAAQAGKPAEAPLSNTDIVKLSKLGFGDDVVIAKINQAARVNFQVATDDLISLKDQGVSSGVIAAMIRRSSPTGQSGGSTPSVAASPKEEGGEGAKKVQEPAYLGTFSLLDPATGRLSDLERQIPEGRARAGFKDAQSYMRIMGTRSPVRFKEGQHLEFVVLVRQGEVDPRDLITFYSMKSEDDYRLIIRVNTEVSFFGGVKSETDKGESEVGFDALQYGASSLKVVPTETLLPGEYALLAPGSRAAFCFGIDADPSFKNPGIERIVQFKTGVSLSLGIVQRVIRIDTVEVTGAPNPEVHRKAKDQAGETTTLTAKFTYSNRGEDDWKCMYRVAILDDRGEEIGSGEKERGLGGRQEADTNSVSVKMRTLDFPEAAKLRVRVLLRPD